MKPTPQQQAVVDAVATGTENILVEALAGTGKTTLIVMAIGAYRERHPAHEVLVCAYNKAIADEVGERLKRAGHTDWRLTQAATAHKMGWGLVRFVFKSEIDDRKVRKLVEEYAERNDGRIPAHIFREYSEQIEKLVRVAKQAGVGFFDDVPIGDRGTWYQLADHYDINGFDDTTHIDDVARAAVVIYKESLRRTDVCDFDDMILWPLIKGLRVKFQKDLIFVDEAQDLSRARQALIRKFVKPAGRIVVVGDRNQAIYGFSGADSDALPRMAAALSARLLPLSVTWRCPRAVVEMARTIVPSLEAAPGAREGVVGTIEELPERMGPETAVLCRNTAPLVELAYQLIRAGTPCKVEGRDIGQGLTSLLNRWKVKTLDAFLRKLDEYREREVQKAMAKDREDRAQAVGDRCDTLGAIVAECLKQGRRNVSDAAAFVEDLFADGDSSVCTLATYHRSKGREWSRVILLEHASRCPSPWARQEWQAQQERNLAYVAYTRAQDELLFYR